ncbi:MAG: M48 family metalloprotease [Spirochaetota bacterium]|nr:M48 family metalloprotease [Spirochaetota bacterium]
MNTKTNSSKGINKIIFLILFVVLSFGVVKCKELAGLLPYGSEIMTGIEAIDKLVDVYDAYNREFTPQEEYYIGRTVAASLLKKRRLYGTGDSGLEKYISKIGHTLAMTSDRPETYQGYRFIVLNSRSVNAFAVPSGFIFVTTGLIKTASNEDELAGAIAHEVNHIVLRHPTTSISDAQKNEAVSNLVKFGAGKALSSDKALANLTGLFGGIVDEVNKSVLNGYDAQKEKDADLASVKLLVDAGYNPKGLSSMLRKLKKGGGIHGDPNVRAQNVDNLISSYKGKVPNILTYRSNRFKSLIK